MDANSWITIIAGCIVALPGITALYLQWKRETRQAPLEDASKAVDTSSSAAVALKSYSDEVIRLRGELAQMRIDLAGIKEELEMKNDQLAEWQVGIKRLIAQLVSMNATPVWRPRITNGIELEGKE